MSAPHEAAIKNATPKALLPPEEQPPSEPVAAPVVPEKGTKGKGKGAAATAAGRKGSKTAIKPVVEVRKFFQRRVRWERSQVLAIVIVVHLAPPYISEGHASRASQGSCQPPVVILPFLCRAELSRLIGHFWQQKAAFLAGATMSNVPRGTLISARMPEVAPRTRGVAPRSVYDRR